MNSHKQYRVTRNTTIAIMAMVLSFTFSPFAQAALRGDLNGDGKVSVADSTVAVRIFTGIQPATGDQLAAGDLNGNGRIDSADATAILRMALGLPVTVISPNPVGLAKPIIISAEPSGVTAVIKTTVANIAGITDIALLRDGQVATYSPVSPTGSNSFTLIDQGPLAKGGTYTYVVGSYGANGVSAVMSDTRTVKIPLDPVIPITPDPVRQLPAPVVNATYASGKVTVTASIGDLAGVGRIIISKNGAQFYLPPLPGFVTQVEDPGPFKAGESITYAAETSGSGSTPGKGSATVLIPNSTTNPITPTPATPTGLTASSTYRQVDLSWNPVSGASDYILSKSGPAGAQTLAPTGITYVDTDVSPEKNYTYSVASRNSAGAASAFSQVISVGTPAAPPPTPQVQVPGTPQNLRSEAGANTVTLKWDAVANATDYVVFRNGNTSIYGTAPKPAAGTVPSYVDTNVSPGNMNSYQVAARNSASTSSLSNIAWGMPTSSQNPQPQAPAVPSISSISATGNIVTVGWAPITGASSYTVRRLSATGQSADVYTGAQTTIQDTAPAAGNYNYQVMATGSAGSSAWSSASPVTVTAPSGGNNGNQNQNPDPVVNTTTAPASILSGGAPGAPLRVEGYFEDTPGSNNQDKTFVFKVARQGSQTVRSGKIIVNFGNLEIKRPDAGGEIMYGWLNGDRGKEIRRASGKAEWVSSISRNSLVMRVDSDMLNSTLQSQGDYWMFGVVLNGHGSAVKINPTADATAHVIAVANSDTQTSVKADIEYRGNGPCASVSWAVLAPDWSGTNALAVSADGTIATPLNSRVLLASTGLSIDTQVNLSGAGGAGYGYDTTLVSPIALTVETAGGLMTYPLSTSTANGRSVEATLGLPSQVILFPHAVMQGSITLYKLPAGVASQIPAGGSIRARLGLAGVSAFGANTVYGGPTNSKPWEVSTDYNSVGSDLILNIHRLN